MRCTGVCCTKIYISVPWSDLLAREDPEAVLLREVMQPAPESDPNLPHQLHVCTALTDTGCSLDYTNRPEMCRSYPYGGNTSCRACGSGSDAEARGVAIIRLEEVK